MVIQLLIVNFHVSCNVLLFFLLLISRIFFEKTHNFNPFKIDKVCFFPNIYPSWEMVRTLGRTGDFLSIEVKWHWLYASDSLVLGVNISSCSINPFINVFISPQFFEVKSLFYREDLLPVILLTSPECTCSVGEFGGVVCFPGSYS